MWLVWLMHLHHSTIPGSESKKAETPGCGTTVLVEQENPDFMPNREDEGTGLSKAFWQ